MRPGTSWLALLPIAAMIAAPSLASAPLERSAPAVTTISPSVVPAGAPAFRIKVEGSGFTRAAYVRWNGAMRPTLFDKPTTLYADISAADLATTGLAQISVVTPDDGAESNRVRFTIGNPLPTLTSISPLGAVWYGEPFTLFVQGTRFVPGAVVRWNGSARPTTFVSPTQLRTNIPASDLAIPFVASSKSARPPAVRISVLNPAPGGGTSSHDTLFIAVAPPPSVTQIYPSQQQMGSGAFIMNVGGGYFLRASVVHVNGNARPTMWMSESLLQATIPASDMAAQGTFPVSVRTTIPNNLPQESQGTTTLTVLPPATISVPTTISVVRFSTAPLTFMGTNLFSVRAKVNGAWRGTQTSYAKQFSVTLDPLDVATTRQLALTIESTTPPATIASSTISVVNAQPTLTSISIRTVLPGGAGFVLLVRGSQIAPETIVRVNGTARPTTILDRSSLLATIPSTDVKPGAPASIRLFSPAPGGGSSNALSFGGT